MNAPSSAGKTLKSLHGRARLRYIWDYYKLPLAVACILLYILGYMIYGHVTHKDRPLYVALVNVSAGEQLQEQLTDGFLEYEGLSPSKNQVYLYTGLTLTADPNSAGYSYTYASRVKILAALDGQQMDLVLANREVFDAFAEEGYLYDLETLLSEKDPALCRRLSPYLTTGPAPDGLSQENPGPDATAQGVSSPSSSCPTGLDLSGSPMIQAAGLDGKLYLGVIGNSPRLDTVIDYLEYLFPEREPNLSQF